ncbi:unnamed protein product [Arabidopsis arenosa]|uniref:Uncharacterized protein n=1 Tax=Arabidopsis arenosa TaxID=38785 RepID=A0A8S1ZL98_ARAAE|nr:unnamed protein product [Arabidopsis arenosa]
MTGLFELWTVLCSLLNQLSPGSMRMGGSFEPASVKIERFLTALGEMALPSKKQGDMVPVFQSLKALKASYDKNSLAARRRWSLPGDHSDSRGDNRNFTIGLQSKEGSEIDMSDAKISELLKSNSLRNAPTRSLFDMLDKLLDESIIHIYLKVSKNCLKLSMKRYGNSYESYLVAVVCPSKIQIEHWAKEHNVSGDFESICQN